MNLPHLFVFLLLALDATVIFGNDSADENTFSLTPPPPSIETIRVTLLDSSQSSNVCTPQIDLEPLKIPLWTLLGRVNSTESIEQQIFQSCSPNCQNGGICRDGQCICPLNFSGVDCADDITPKLSKCTESTCQNGGMCVGTSSQPACQCAKDMRGATCERRPRSYVIHLNISHDDKTEASTKKAEPDSDLVSKAAEKWVDLSAKLGNDRFLVKSYLSAHFESFLDNNETIAVRLTYDFTDSMALQYTTNCILGQVLTGANRLKEILLAESKNRTEIAKVKLADVRVQAEDMCKSGNHDCSMHATCKMLNVGSYTCVCNTFTIDISLDDRFPGRRCVYDGLIILIFILVGFVLSTLIIILCGCRRTIWYRRFGKNNVDHMNLVNVAKNYDI